MNNIDPSQLPKWGMIDPSQLPNFVTAQAINLAYTEASLRLANSMNLETFMQLREFEYKVGIKDKTGKVRNIQAQGQIGTFATPLLFEDAISIFAILRFKQYTSIYGAASVTVTVEGPGDADRFLNLIETRPDFAHLKLSEGVLGDEDSSEAHD